MIAGRARGRPAFHYLRNGGAQGPAGARNTGWRAARAPVPGSEVAALRSACPPAEGRPADLATAQTLLEQAEAYDTALGR